MPEPLTSLDVIGTEPEPLDVILPFNLNPYRLEFDVVYAGAVEVCLRTYQLDGQQRAPEHGIIDIRTLFWDFSEMLNVLYYTEIQARVMAVRNYAGRYGDRRNWLKRAAEDVGFDVVDCSVFEDKSLSAHENKEEIRSAWKGEVFRE